MRLERRNWKESDVGIKSSGGLLDLFDNQIKSLYRITDDEFDFIAERITDGESTYFLGEAETFSEKRETLKILFKYLEEFKKQQDEKSI